MPTVCFRSVREVNVEPDALGPAPSVRDWEEINEGLKGVANVDGVEDLAHGTTHEIRASYRGWIMYLYPNVSFIRTGNGRGGNGYAGAPKIGDREVVKLRVGEGAYEADIEYVT